MHPVIFQIGRFQLHTYGLAMGLAFFFAIWWAIKRAPMAGVNKAFIFDLAVVVMISSLLGARLTYVVGHWGEYRRHLLDIISPIQSDGTLGIAGMVLLGGVIAAVVVGGWYLKRKQVPFWQMADVSAPPLALGIGIGRLGCFFNGCCFGHPTTGWLGIVFPSGCYAASVYPGIAIHPTQLYDAAGAFVIAAVLPIFEKRWRSFSGWTASWFLILAGLDRFIVEGYRYYEPDKCFEFLGTQWTGSRIVALGMVVLGIVTLIILSKKKNKLTDIPKF
jgi:phosphatidylglycerol:prolipoprotein diacylglycerol transferase